MSAFRDTERCFLCKTGRIVRTHQEMAFKQHTEKGYVFCCVAIPMDVCNDCGLKSWDDDAEAIIENAVRQKYEGLRRQSGKKEMKTAADNTIT